MVSQNLPDIVNGMMAAAGMYDAAGSWFSDVGIPAKSGVAGGLLGALPGQVGLGAFSPRLDEHGNSVRGVELFSRIPEYHPVHVEARLQLASIYEDQEDYAAALVEVERSDPDVAAVLRAVRALLHAGGAGANGFEKEKEKQAPPPA